MNGNVQFERHGETYEWDGSVLFAACPCGAWLNAELCAETSGEQCEACEEVYAIPFDQFEGALEHARNINEAG